MKKQKAYMNMVETEGWRLFKEHIEDQIRKCKNSLVLAEEEKDIRVLQGRVQAYEEIFKQVEHVLRHG